MGTEYRINFDIGHAVFDGTHVERVDDLVLPRRVDVTFPGVDREPSLYLRLELIDGTPECTELRLERSDGGREVRTKDLEAIRVRDWTEDIYARCAMPVIHQGDGTTLVVGPGPQNDPIPALRTFGEMRRKNTRRLNRGRLREAAQVYVDNLAGDPIHAVAERFDISRRTASDWITKARDAGILSPTERGKKGGHLLDPDPESKP